VILKTSEQGGIPKMTQNEARVLGLASSARLDETHYWSPVQGEISQVEFLAAVLTQAFHNEPRIAYILPEEVARRSVLPWFFRSVASRASQFCGEIYTTATPDGGILWISPGRQSTFARIMRTEMQAANFNLPRATFRRGVNLWTHLERVHRRLAKGPHWYLAALGARSLNTVKAMSGALLEPVLARADRDRLPCYVEIFHESSLPFYGECGFQIAGAGQVPRGGPSFWAMIRTPHE
jgi:hypothetical protein